MARGGRDRVRGVSTSCGRRAAGSTSPFINQTTGNSDERAAHHVQCPLQSGMGDQRSAEDCISDTRELRCCRITQGPTKQSNLTTLASTSVPSVTEQKALAEREAEGPPYNAGHIFPAERGDVRRRKALNEKLKAISAKSQKSKRSH